MAGYGAARGAIILAQVPWDTDAETDLQVWVIGKLMVTLEE